MADSNVSLLDSAGNPVTVDAQLVGTDRQQTVTIGDGTNAGRIVRVDTDGSLQCETNPATTAVKSNVTATTTSTTILAANANRRGAIIFNDSTVVLYISYGTGTTSTTSFSMKVAAGAVYLLDVPLYNGAMTGMWAASPTESARVTDISA
jgi:hypothetical protein